MKTVCMPCSPVPICTRLRLPGKGSPRYDKGKVCPFGRKAIELKLKYGICSRKSAFGKPKGKVLCNIYTEPLIIQRFLNNSTDTNSSWDVQSFWGSAAEWTAKLVAMLGIPAGIATGCVETFMGSAAFEIIADAIHNKSTMTLRATVISHTITGSSTSPLDSTYHSATLYGKTATITAPGSRYEGYNYKSGYSATDWRNNAFGRAMFKAVYNSDWTPTGWTD